MSTERDEIERLQGVISASDIEAVDKDRLLALVADSSGRRRQGVDWRSIADVLADRMICIARECETHDKPDANCPFCEDLAALQQYQKAAGLRPQPEAPGRRVAIQDVKYTGPPA